MPNIFSNINFNVVKTTASTFDFKLLDTVCNHQILNEDVVVDLSPIFSGASYGNSTFGIDTNFGNDIATNASVIFTTQLPISGASIQVFEYPNSTINNPLVETFTVPVTPSGLFGTTFQLAFPPVPNSVTAQQYTTSVDYDGSPEIVYFPFSNYTLSQLFGLIQFNNLSDITNPATVVQFSYVGDIRQIFMNNKQYSPNWKFLGYNIKGQGVFQIWGRSFLDNKSSLVIRYTTSEQSCPRCGGTGLVNDLDFNASTNRYMLVYDFSKLVQDFFKRFFTRRGSNIFDLSDGTQIPIYVGMNKNIPQLTQTLITNEIVSLVNVIRSKQNVQLIVQGIGLGEQLAQINQLTITPVGLTDVNVMIEVQSLSNSTAQIQTSVGSH